MPLRESDLASIAAATRSGPIAYIETEYFGGVGEQAAALWRDGKMVIDFMTEVDRRVHEGSPINFVLRELGVLAVDGCDEFTVQGLVRFRCNEDILNQGVECEFERA